MDEPGIKPLQFSPEFVKACEDFAAVLRRDLQPWVRAMNEAHAALVRDLVALGERMAAGR